MWFRTKAEAAARQAASVAAIKSKTAHHGGNKLGPTRSYMTQDDKTYKHSPLYLGFSHVSPIKGLSLDPAHYELHCYILEMHFYHVWFTE